MYAQQIIKTCYMCTRDDGTPVNWLMANFPLFKIWSQSISELCWGSRAFLIPATRPHLTVPTHCTGITKVLQRSSSKDPAPKIQLKDPRSQWWHLGSKWERQGNVLLLVVNLKNIWIFMHSTLWLEKIHQNSLDQDFSAWHHWHLEQDYFLFGGLGRTDPCIPRCSAAFLDSTHLMPVMTTQQAKCPLGGKITPDLEPLSQPIGELY